MESQRQRAFQKLRPPCVDLSSKALAFRAHQADVKSVQIALETLYEVLIDVSREEALDEKLAEYAFFPLTHIFNESQRASVRCLELAVRCLQILVSAGWKTKMSPELGKQLLILLTMIAGGLPNQSPAKPMSEELTTAAYDCMRTIFATLDGPVYATAIFNAIGTATVVDQIVYLLLQGITDGGSDSVQVAAVAALSTLYLRVTTRVVLASLLPRTISALTQSLRPTTQMKRSYTLLKTSLGVFTDAVRAVLNDRDVYADIEAAGNGPLDDNALDASWLKATASQVKLALGHVIRLRSHAKSDVRKALLELCLMTIEQCRKSLADSLHMMVDTLVVLSEPDEEESHSAMRALKHLTLSDENIRDLVQSSLHSWTQALPRVMQSNDDSAKTRILRQIATAYRVLSETQSTSLTLDESLADSICNSVALIARPFRSGPVTVSDSLQLLTLTDTDSKMQYPPILLNQQSEKGTLVEMLSLIGKVSVFDSSHSMTKTMLERIYSSSGNELLASFWLALRSLKGEDESVSLMDDFLDFGPTSSSRATLIEELYSFALPVLLDLPSASPADWELPALALEAVALQAVTIGVDFRTELIDTLYPTLQLLGSSNSMLRSHAMTTLNILASACEYKDTSSLLIENVDYLVNAVALKLNTFDLSPQAPQVLLMMIKLCGARLVPYLDDLVGSIFAALDAFHGYPKLVELLFSVLGAIIDESSKAPSLLAITSGKEDIGNTTQKERKATTTIDDIIERITKQKRRQEERAQEDKDVDEGKVVPHPKRPWTSALDGPPKTFDEEMEAIKARDAAAEGAEDEEEEADPANQPKPDASDDPEKAISKPHLLLLHIAKSIPPHLSSPASSLRLSLLSLLERAAPLLASDENTFLPFINDIWPSLASRISSPVKASKRSNAVSSLLIVSSSATKKSQIEADTDINDEALVAAAACTTINGLCKHAGDFMTSRIETEIPAWSKTYIRLWSQVSIDLDTRRRRRRRHVAATQTQPNNTSITTPSSSSYFTRNHPTHRLWLSLALLLSSILLTTPRLNPLTSNSLLRLLSPLLALEEADTASDTDLSALRTQVEEACTSKNRFYSTYLKEQAILRREWRMEQDSLRGDSPQTRYPPLKATRSIPAATEDDVQAMLSERKKLQTGELKAAFGVLEKPFREMYPYLGRAVRGWNDVVELEKGKDVARTGLSVERLFGWEEDEIVAERKIRESVRRVEVWM